MIFVFNTKDRVAMEMSNVLSVSIGTAIEDQIQVYTIEVDIIVGQSVVSKTISYQLNRDGRDEDYESLLTMLSSVEY